MASIKPCNPRVGISRCLLGDKVRYDGKDQSEPGLIAQLQHYFQLQPFCPEVEAGMGVPRPPIQLLKQAQNIRCIQVDPPHQDMTDLLQQTFEQYKNIFHPLHGFVLKSRSPSCGLSGAKQITPLGLYRNGQGLFVQWLKQQFPGLPVSDEIHLQQPAQLALFRQQVEQFRSNS